MGSFCCKRLKTEPNRQRTEAEFGKNVAEGCNQEFLFDEITDKSKTELKDDVSGNKGQATELDYDRIRNKLHLNDADMQKNGKTNNLELYLNDVFEKECEIKAEKVEVEFIQTGIETLAQKIVDLTLAEYHPTGDEKDYFKQMEESLEEVYFPLKMKRKPKRFFVKVKTKRSIIIKVGSFYEGTKNDFPDEFDLIFPLFSIRVKQYPALYCETLQKASTPVWSVTSDNAKSLVYVSPNDTQDVTRKLYFKKYLKNSGPAFKLQFIYNNGSGEERYIHVDLVPAFKMMVNNNLDWYVQYVDMYVKLSSFRKEVLSAKNCLRVQGGISFTETEVYFMRNILSKNHVKVYRILKFLINGHRDGEILGLYHLTSSSAKGYSSYLIKTLMIYHHDECTNPEAEELGPCVIQILEEMCKYTKSGNFPTFSPSNLYTSPIFLPYLKSLTDSLKSAQAVEDGYDYERIRVKSVSRQYLDGLERNMPENAVWFMYLDDIGGVDQSIDSLWKYSDDLDIEDADYNNLFKLMENLQQISATI